MTKEGIGSAGLGGHEKLETARQMRRCMCE